MLFKKLSVTLLSFVLIICLFITSVFATDVYLGGESIGIKLNYEGILISGTYDISIDNKTYNPSYDGYQKGDLITHIDGRRVKTIDELMTYIESNINKSFFEIDLMRKQRKIKNKLFISLKNNQFSTGLYVQDQIAGIGTVTYYNPNNQSFGALGHIMESQDGSELILDRGYIYNSYVKGIVESKKGNPGEKIADIDDIDIGVVSDNNAYGIYGNYYKEYLENRDLISIALTNEIKKDKAYFITVVEGNKKHKCDIEITNINMNSSSKLKGITFKITDQYIIDKTNGIVQGMSGSPIIQDGKLVGAVTHVLVNDPTRGYGIFIENMLEAAE